jgi:transposase
LAELVAKRRQIVEMIGMKSNRRRQARSAKVLRGIERTLAALQAALAELDQEIDGQVRSSPAWRASEDLLTSVPGIGKITARTLIAELPRARPPRPPADRRPGRRRPAQPRQRRLPGPPGDRRRPHRNILYIAALTATA